MIDVCASVNDNSSVSRYVLCIVNLLVSDGSVRVAVLQSDARFRCNVSEPVDRQSECKQGRPLSAEHGCDAGRDSA